MKKVRAAIGVYFVVVGMMVASQFRSDLFTTLIFVYSSLIPTIYILVDVNAIRRIGIGLIGTVWSLYMFFVFDSVFATPVMNALYDERDFIGYRGGGHQFSDLVEYGDNFMSYITFGGFWETLLSLASFLVCVIIVVHSFVKINKSATLIRKS